MTRWSPKLPARMQVGNAGKTENCGEAKYNPYEWVYYGDYQCVMRTYVYNCVYIIYTNIYTHILRMCICIYNILCIYIYIYI